MYLPAKRIIRKSNILRFASAFMRLPIKSKITITLLIPFYFAWLLGLRILGGVELCAFLYHPKFGRLRFCFDVYYDIDTLFEELLFGFYYKYYEPSADHVVVDIGANIGDFSIPLSKSVRKIYAIEGFPETFLKLRKNICVNKCHNVKPYFILASDFEGVGYIQKGHFSSGGSKMTFKISEETYKVPVNKLDNILMGLDKIDLLKIDVEGMGHKVLKGGQSILSITSRVIIEVHTKEEEIEVNRMLRSFGFITKVLKDPSGYPNFLIGVKRHNYE